MRTLLDAIALASLSTLGGTAGVALLTLVLSLIFVRRYRADAGLRAAQAALPESESSHRIIRGQEQGDALRESEARMRAITDAAQDAILMMDPEGRVSFWNPAAERILGYTSVEAVGQDLHALIMPPRYQTAQQAAFSAFRRTGQGSAVGQTLALEARRKDGKEIAVELSLSSVFIQGGWHAVGLVRDISERKLAEAEIQQAHRNLEEAVARASQMAVQATLADTAKSEFLANMSHENDYITKPVDPRALAASLDEWLPKETAATDLPIPEVEAMATAAMQERDPPVFDRAGVMARLLDDKELVRLVAESIVENTPGQIESLRAHLDVGDASGILRLAHAIKGASATAGGEALRAVASQIERAGMIGDLDAVAARMDDLVVQYDRLQAAIKEEFASRN